MDRGLQMTPKSAEETKDKGTDEFVMLTAENANKSQGLESPGMKRTQSTSVHDHDDKSGGGVFGCIKNYLSVSTFVPTNYVYDQFEDDIRYYDLNTVQRYFMTFEDPNASAIGRVINVITIATIVLSVASFISSPIG